MKYDGLNHFQGVSVEVNLTKPSVPAQLTGDNALGDTLLPLISVRQRLLCITPEHFSWCPVLVWILFHWNSPSRLHFWYHHVSLLQSYLILHLLNMQRQDFQTMLSAIIPVFQNHPWSHCLSLLMIWAMFHFLFNIHLTLCYPLWDKSLLGPTKHSSFASCFAVSFIPDCPDRFLYPQCYSPISEVMNILSLHLVWVI